MQSTKFHVCTVVFLFLACLAACENQVKTSDLDVQTIDRSAVQRMLDGGDGGEEEVSLLVDVRSWSEYKKGHIPGAVHIPVPRIKADDPHLRQATRIVVYGSGWTDYLSRAASKKLVALGFQNVYDFRGGLEAWMAGGK